MSKIKAAITAVGSYVPEDILSNAMLENMVETNDEWITSRTGIKERHILKDPTKGSSFMGIKAAEDLFQKNNIDPATIDLLIFASTTPDMPVASTGAYTATHLGCTNAFAYDLQSACTGFLFAMSAASSYIESGRYKKVLVIGADKMSSIIDYQDRTTCIIFGDGAGAALFEPNEEGYGVQDEMMRGDGTGRQYLKVDAGGSVLPTSQDTIDQQLHYVRQDGKTVFKTAVTKMAEISAKVMERNQLTADDIDWLVPHQANKRIIDATAKELTLDSAKVLMNIQKYGNTTSATLPLVLADFEHTFKKGDKIILTSFGAGFSWGATYLTWAHNS